MRYQIFILFLLFSFAAKSQPVKIERNNLVLTAIKKHRAYEFNTGKPVTVIYTLNDNVEKVKGKIKSLTADGFYLSGFNKHDTSIIYIPLNSILSVTKLLRNDRLLSGIIIAASAVGTALILSKLTNNPPQRSSGYEGLLVVVPAAVGFGGAVSFASTYLDQTINTKSIKRGFHFSIQ